MRTPEELQAMLRKARKRYLHSAAQFELSRRWQQLRTRLWQAEPDDRWITVCASCHRFRDPHEEWLELPLWAVDRFHVGVDITHGLCPTCYAKMDEESRNN